MSEKKAMLIEHSASESRIAVIENDRLAELFIERSDHRAIVGNIYKGKVSRVLPGMQAAFVDIGLERNAFLFVGEVIDPLASYDDLVRDRAPTIGELIAPGQELLLQILKDPQRGKGARVSTEITLPGRYLVLLPGHSEQAGVSRRIEDPVERERLRDLAAELRPEGAGLIVRTAGAGQDRSALAADRDFLLGRWQRIDAKARSASPPSLVHRDLDLVERVVRDLLDDSFDVVRVADEETHARVCAFIEDIEPSLVPRVKLDAYDTGLFARFGVDQAIETALKPRVWLRSGGSLVIDQTEALVAIDVNTSRFVGRTSLEDTVLATNLEAVAEIARQLRLRSLGGIIVVDLIDMESAENRQRVLAALEAELAKDRAKTKLLGISDFGLVQLTRKRSRPSLERQLTDPCPYCRGTARIRSASLVFRALRRDILAAQDKLSGEVVVRVHPEVAVHVEQEGREVLDAIERELGVAIILEGDAALHHERFEILPLVAT